MPCYPSIEALPQAPDVGIVLLGVERAHIAVRELAARSTKAAIVLASGFGETGADGFRRQAELLEAAGRMPPLGPNTIGLVNLTDRISLAASGALEMDAFAAGSISMVSQSGGILGALLSRATGRGIGLPKLISTGNEVDLKIEDFVDVLADDPATRVIALYIKGIRDPERFRAAALKAASAGKPIVTYKVGRSEAGAFAAASHTGAMAGSDKVYDAFFFRRSRRHSRRDIHRSSRHPADAGGRTQDGRKQGRHSHIHRGCRNPIDVTLAGLQPMVLRGACEALLESPSSDALAIIVGSSGVAAPDLMADAIKPSLARTDKPVVAYVSPHAPQAVARLKPTTCPPSLFPRAARWSWKACSAQPR